MLTVEIPNSTTQNMFIFLDMFDSDDDDDFLMWTFGGVSLGSMGRIFSEKQCGSVDDHDKQEAQSGEQDHYIEESPVDLHEGCKDEQNVEENFVEFHIRDTENTERKHSY